MYVLEKDCEIFFNSILFNLPDDFFCKQKKGKQNNTGSINNDEWFTMLTITKSGLFLHLLISFCLFTQTAEEVAQQFIKMYNIILEVIDTFIQLLNDQNKLICVT